MYNVRVRERLIKQEENRARLHHSRIDVEGSLIFLPPDDEGLGPPTRLEPGPEEESLETARLGPEGRGAAAAGGEKEEVEGPSKGRGGTGGRSLFPPGGVTKGSG